MTIELTRLAVAFERQRLYRQFQGLMACMYG